MQEQLISLIENFKNSKQTFIALSAFHEIKRNQNYVVFYILIRNQARVRLALILIFDEMVFC